MYQKSLTNVGVPLVPKVIVHLSRAEKSHRSALGFRIEPARIAAWDASLLPMVTNPKFRSAYCKVHTVQYDFLDGARVRSYL